MIGDFENTAVVLGFPRNNLIDASMLRSFIITQPDFQFDSLEDFMDKSIWQDYIKLEEIFPIGKMLEVDDKSEKTEYITSDLDYEYVGKEGKYRYIFRTPFIQEYHDYIKSMSGIDMKVFLSNASKGVMAHNTGSVITGLDVELFHVEKKQFGEKTPYWTQIYIVLIDPEEYNEYQVMDFNPNTFNLLPVTISEITSDGNDVTFTVKDTIWDFDIDNLYVGDVIFVDNTGTLQPLSLTRIECGKYTAVLPSQPSFGEISIDSDYYYGDLDYYLNVDTVVSSNFLWLSKSHMLFDVNVVGNPATYSGLLVGDFVFTDDIHGVIVPTSFSEPSSGRYEVEFAEVLTDGDIDIDDGVVTGSTPYIVDLILVLSNIVQNSADSFDVDIKDPSGNPYTGLVLADFYIDDDIVGEEPLTSVVESPAGTYIIISDIAFTSGLISIIGDYISGTIAYDFEQTSFRNGGGTGTTDWINPTDGVAEFWSQQLPTNKDASIVTGSGFIGNAQRGESLVGDIAGTILLAGAIYFKPGSSYQLSFKYRSNRNLIVYLFTDLEFELFTPTANIGNAILYTSPVFTIDSDISDVTLNFSLNKLTSQSGYIEIDEIELIEV